jgi:hypothetical protein
VASFNELKALKENRKNSPEEEQIFPSRPDFSLEVKNSLLSPLQSWWPL